MRRRKTINQNQKYNKEKSTRNYHHSLGVTNTRISFYAELNVKQFLPNTPNYNQQTSKESDKVISITCG